MILFGNHGYYHYIADDRAREDILKIHSRKMNLMRGINMRKIAEAIPGASGAEVKVRKSRKREGEGRGVSDTRDSI